MYVIIYKTTNLINGKIYVGKDSINDPLYFGSGLILNRAIKKYGISNFKKDILEHCGTPQELDERERYWIKELNSTDKSIGYNIAKGGSGGDTFSNQPHDRKIEIRRKIDATRSLWDTPTYREKCRNNTKKLWMNPLHRDYMVKTMTGREIKWANKISDSIKEWHKTNPIPEESKRNAAEKIRQKMTGYEFKSVPLDVQEKIVELYQTMGPRLIERQLGVSQYLIVRVLKQRGIYQKWQKGIGEKSKKLASISKCGTNNPMVKKSP